MCSSQRRVTPKPEPPSESTSSSRVVCSRQAAPSRPSRTIRWIVVSIPPVRPSRGWHGSAIFGAGSSSAPLPSSTPTRAAPLRSSADERPRRAGFTRTSGGRRRPRSAPARRTRRRGRRPSRDARVIVAAIAPKRSSRTAASAESLRAPCALNGCFRSGVSPSCALAKALRRSSATGTFLSRPIGASSSTAVPRSSALSPASGTLEASSGAISASASTSPTCRAPTVSVPLRVSPAPRSSADVREHRHAPGRGRRRRARATRS